MLIRFSVTRKDSGAPVPNARIEVEKAETVGYTDSQGKAEIVTYWSGNWLYSVGAPGYGNVNGTVDNRDIPVLDFGVTLLYNAISPPSTPGFKEEIIDRVGTSCSIINNYSFAKSAYQVRHDRKGNLSSLHMDLVEVRGIANRSPECFETPPPPPKTTDELGAEVSTLQKLLNSTVGKIENIAQGIGDIISKAETEAAEWRKAVDGIWDKLEGWMIERIVGILLKGLDREVEMRK
jgi:hypothetical protein